MERLTFEGNFCDIARCERTPGGSDCEKGSCTQREVWERLKAYEETGLTPEEVSLLAKAGEDGRVAVYDTRTETEKADLLLVADKEGRVRIMPESNTGTCGSCENFERIQGTKRGVCKVHHYCKNRYGTIEERRGRFMPAQSRKSCKQYNQRGSGGSVKGG